MRCLNLQQFVLVSDRTEASVTESLPHLGGLQTLHLDNGLRISMFSGCIQLSHMNLLIVLTLIPKLVLRHGTELHSLPR